MTDNRYVYRNGHQVGVDWTRLGYESNPAHPVADSQSGTSMDRSVQ